MEGDAMGDTEGDVKDGWGVGQHSSKHKVPMTTQNSILPVFSPREQWSLFRLLTKQCVRTHRHIGDLKAATLENLHPAQIAPSQGCGLWAVARGRHLPYPFLTYPLAPPRDLESTHN